MLNRFRSALKQKYADMMVQAEGAVISMVTKDNITSKQSIANGETASWSLIWTTFKIIWPMALTMTVLFAQKFVIFPGMIFNGHWTFIEESNPWRTVIIVGLWNTCDAFGRFAPTCCSKFVPPKPVVWILTVAKFGLVYTSMLCVFRYNPDSKFFMSTPVQIANLMINGVLFGLLITYTMILGTSNKAQPGYSRKVAGFLMATTMILGTALGSTLAVWLNDNVLGRRSHPSHLK